MNLSHCGCRRNKETIKWNWRERERELLENTENTMMLTMIITIEGKIGMHPAANEQLWSAQVAASSTLALAHTYTYSKRTHAQAQHRPHRIVREEGNTESLFKIQVVFLPTQPRILPCTTRKTSNRRRGGRQKKGERIVNTRHWFYIFSYAYIGLAHLQACWCASAIACVYSFFRFFFPFTHRWHTHAASQHSRNFTDQHQIYI